MSRAVRDIVIAHAAGRAVRRVDVAVGRLRAVVPETLTFSWDVITRGTALEEAVLHVEVRPIRIRCRTCGRTGEIDEPRFTCACGSGDVEVTGGDELVVTSLDVAAVA